MITVEPALTGMFRFLLEAYDNLAGFTVLDRHAALLRLFFSPHREREVRAALEDIGRTVPLHVEPWPFPLQSDADGERP